jgi:glycosyltransferase involved in cell wall biosynthesis
VTRRIVYLAHSDRHGPTTRHRVYPFVEALAREGLELEVLPAFGAIYYAAERHLGLTRAALRVAAALDAGARRLRQLPRALSADGVVVEREVFPWTPPLVERLLARRRGGYVLEYDDALWLSPGRSRKFRRITQLARAALVGNDVLAAFAASGGTRALVLPTVVDTRAYRPRGSYELGRPPRIGWVGLASNLHHLAQIAGPLRRVCAQSGARVVVVSARPPALELPVDFVPWSEAAEAEVLATFDVGIMPLADTAFARGKCGLKLLQYMAAGVPVVGSPVGVNATIVHDGIDGRLASDEASWFGALSELLSDESLRARLGRAGRARVERDYSVEAWTPRVVAAYRELFGA